MMQRCEDCGQNAARPPATVCPTCATARIEKIKAGDNAQILTDSRKRVTARKAKVKPRGISRFDRNSDKIRREHDAKVKAATRKHKQREEALKLRKRQAAKSALSREIVASQGKLRHDERMAKKAVT